MGDKSLSFITLNNSLVFNIDNKSVTVMKGTAQYADVCLALSEGRFNDIPNIIDKLGGLQKTLKNGEFDVVNGVVRCGGEPVDPYISEKLLEFYEKGLPYKPLQNFWKRLCKNPSKNSVSQLYRFLEVAKCPIAEDGMIVSMKGVHRVSGTTDEFYSRHDHNFKYKIGVPAIIDRNRIPDDPTTACGIGLHAGSFSYARGWASTVIELLIDPADVVSVPNDCSSQKLRACKVLPVAVYTGGEHNKGIAIVSDDAETVPLNPVVAPDAVAVAGTGMIINRAAYKDVAFTAAAFDNVIALKPAVGVKGLMRYRASKAPAAIRRHVSEAGAALSEAYIFTVPNKSSETLFISLADNKGTPIYTLFVPAAVSDTDAESIVAYIADERVVKKAEVVNLFTKAYTGKALLHLVTYVREQYELIKVSHKTVDAFLAANSEGVIVSATGIKPSKAPSALLKDYSIQKIVRVTLESSVAFVLQLVDGTVLLMRKE